MLCGKSDHPYDFVIYQGSTAEINSEILKTGFDCAVKMKLVDRIPKDATGHRLFFDNFC